MAKIEFGLGTLAKSAMIWLTAALLFASMFGALLSARPDRPSLTIAQPRLEAVAAVETDTAAR